MTTLDVHPGLDRIAEAVQKAGPGDTVILKSGIHEVSRPIELPRGGDRNHPLTIRGEAGCAILGDRMADPFDLSPSHPACDQGVRLPDKSDWCVFRLRGLDHVDIQGIRFANCWPLVVYAENCRYLRFLDNQVFGATSAVCVRDYVREGDASHHLVFEHNFWCQDTSYGHRLWREVDWREAHSQEGGCGTKRYFAGAFFVGIDVIGQVRFAHNRIFDAFNGIAAWMTKELQDPANETEMRRRNRDFHIFDNDFTRVRNSPVEPEGHAFNWHIRHNRLYNCHAWFSLDRVRGGLWYIYGNRGWFDERQGGPECNTGKVLKLQEHNGQRLLLPDHPYYVFNNSWYLRCPIVGGASPQLPELGEGPDFTAHLGFFNNAFTWCDPGLHGEWVCELIELMRFFDLAKSPATSFDYDITDRADYLAYFQRDGQGEAHGVLATRPIFDDPAAGRFTLPGNSQARDCGRTEAVELADSRGLAELQLQANGLLSRGAYQDYGLTKVPLLEAATDDLLAELAQDPAPSLRRRTPTRRKEAPAKKKAPRR